MLTFVIQRLSRFPPVWFVIEQTSSGRSDSGMDGRGRCPTASSNDSPFDLRLWISKSFHFCHSRSSASATSRRGVCALSLRAKDMFCQPMTTHFWHTTRSRSRTGFSFRESSCARRLVILTCSGRSQTTHNHGPAPYCRKRSMHQPSNSVQK